MKLIIYQDEIITYNRIALSCDFIYSNLIKDKSESYIFINDNDKLKNDIIFKSQNTVSIFTISDLLNKCIEFIKSINKLFILVIYGDVDKINNLTIPNNIIKIFDEFNICFGSVTATWIGMKQFAEFYNSNDYVMYIESDTNRYNDTIMALYLDYNKNHEIYLHFKNHEKVRRFKNKMNEFEKLQMFSRYIFTFFINLEDIWLALYLGTIPIIHNELYNKILFDDLPIVVYSKLDEITDDFLANKLCEYKKTQYNIDKLKISYWKQYIDTFK